MPRAERAYMLLLSDAARYATRSAADSMRDAASHAPLIMPQRECAAHFKETLPIAPRDMPADPPLA